MFSPAFSLETGDEFSPHWPLMHSKACGVAGERTLLKEKQGRAGQSSGVNRESVAKAVSEPDSYVNP